MDRNAKLRATSGTTNIHQQLTKKWRLADRIQCRKQHIFKKNLKWEKMKNVQQLLRQLQTSDHRFRAISALISAASPEKWIGMLS